MVLKKVGDLQIEEEAFDEKQRFWLTQKICVLLMVIFLVGVLFGVTGSGLFSHTTVASTDNNFKLIYDRFGRNTVPNSINIVVSPGLKSTIAIGINKNYLEYQEIVEIAPRPIKVVDAGDKFNFFFLTTPKSLTNILFKVKPEGMGVFKGNIDLENTEALSINQYIFP